MLAACCASSPSPYAQGLPDDAVLRYAEQAGVDLLVCSCGSKRCRRFL